MLMKARTRAVQAFVTVSTNPRVAEVAGGMMTNRPGRDRCGRSPGDILCSATFDMCRTATWVRTRIPFTIAAVNIMNIDFSWLLDFKEFMERIVSLSGAGLYARRAKVKI